ncbi:MAG: Glycosyltransferase, group 2 family protein [Candidatus Gottesmanbacteria bacterium GW2011_GWB1_43_11]|uniref:Glycosyltransferase, group 2 family protein n=1 Tax=Candidatus Gottesmanbacteria bacterium GW2011_GWB1_43_11 TaxID=1618446 RepID=A0A0G1EWU5_9BACT|nr:MAG: Glycosyltransferase, group 2 family protein [Candidatus Gottesmanbacteria bacterium GW2011_GWA2_42_16]KKS56279.1 MAG: Glycosyltransferase, group 2 family protein [Candidatus Gottesmanbacteria bacterium GW2011_GWA1_42_26]KKS82287.1 MAG: Glycosyltransferase, group 2 family protein [Candidatus Gottesmanbacteria bacterium GW2011_GWC1_43_10]KKS87481.1 MAG: Glycosyltransferase, group 2 family protein [Candidatus Gottesmanbacteria bacterium GW2011_GWB1_43_11]OGG10144.1 MAG: hypothetical protei
MPKQIELSLVLPCYNEAQHFNESVARILGVLHEHFSSFEVIFVDDKSQDETAGLIRSYIKNHKSHFTAIYHAQNTGRGQAVTDGINISRGKYVGFMDIDCEISPKYIPEFIDQIKNGADVVCALRRYKVNLPGLVRVVASKFYTVLVHLLLHTSMSDTEAGYKFFRRQSLLPVLKTVHNQGWFWDTEIMVRSERAGLEISFLPVRFNRRLDKTSTVRLVPDALKYFIKLWKFRKLLDMEG